MPRHYQRKTARECEVANWRRTVALHTAKLGRLREQMDRLVIAGNLLAAGNVEMRIHRIEAALADLRRKIEART